MLLAIDSSVAQVRKTPPVKKAEPVKISGVTKPEERPVTISLKDGDPVSGKFVNSSSEGFQIVIAGNPLILKWKDIKQITFTDVMAIEPIEPKIPKEKLAIQSALKSLRKLVAATEVGVNFQEYSSRLIDVKTEINEILFEIPDGDIKNEISHCMEAYADAGTAWNGFNQNQEKYFNMYPASESGKLLLRKYMPIDDKNKFDIERSFAISTIWAAAQKHLENVSKSDSNK